MVSWARHSTGGWQRPLSITKTLRCSVGPPNASHRRGPKKQEPPPRRPVVCPQLKEKHRQSGGGVGALEELENAFSLAEESCPGISDKLMARLVERVQR